MLAFTPAAGVTAYLGTLCQCHLYRHRRMNGFHIQRTFERCRNKALRGLGYHLKALAKEVTGVDLLMILNATWNRVTGKVVPPVTGDPVDELLFGKGEK